MKTTHLVATLTGAFLVAPGQAIFAEAQGASKAATKSLPTKSLYDRLGGEKAVRLVVDDFVAVAAPDPKVDFTRGGKWQASDAAVKTLKDHLVNMICSAAGGPQKYTGRTMKVAHHGMAITQAQFDALAGHLKATLMKHKVGKAEIDELMAVAGSTAADIVEKR